ncbi:hypothetical protein [Streptomyces sp. TLI_55]|uniref:hypothetical protein n=1 Tax=Streptomyces sp. TLI_55 TaxID=1938861 RepID=UPI000BE28F56|nr:hypothetical protein [Streptomyces sp. TLI_55]
MAESQEFLVSFYDMHQDERSYFWKACKVTNVGATELDDGLLGALVASEDGLTWVDPARPRP